MTGQLNEQEINNVLQSQVICRLACCYRRIPYVVPLAYFYDGHALFMQSFDGMKLSIMRRNPRVCVQIDSIQGLKSWKSVLIQGHFEILTGKAEQMARERYFDKIYVLQHNPHIHSFGHDEHVAVIDPIREKPFLFKIKIQTISGRFEQMP
jgi:nitroimidazol reductase NimA-like FMN-containing flavoprotein (pyridoxamine 5'-phosphate oxidase superfamily)